MAKQKKDKFHFGYRGSKRYTHLSKALRIFGIWWSHSHSGNDIELWINDQLVLRAQWNPERYAHDGWYGMECVMSRDVPRKYYKELVAWMKIWTGPESAKEFHDSGYWNYKNG